VKRRAWLKDVLGMTFSAKSLEGATGDVPIDVEERGGGVARPEPIGSGC
jgi:hypothetical protein